MLAKELPSWKWMIDSTISKQFYLIYNLNYKTSGLLFFYSPDNCFYAFDILVDNNTYLDIDETNKLFEQEGLLYAKTLFRGSLEEALSFPNAFDSVISGQLNLPAITPNICEGTIIRPVKNLNFRNVNSKQ